MASAIAPAVQWLPRTFSTDNLKVASRVLNLETSLVNSLWFSSLLAACQTLVSALTGYALSRFEFRFKRFWFMMILMVFIVPLPVLMVPRLMMFITFQDLTKIKMIGTALPQVAMALLGQGVYSTVLILIFYNFFNMIPFDNRKSFLTALYKGGQSRMGLFVKGIPRYYLLEHAPDNQDDRLLPGMQSPLLRKISVNILHEGILQPVLGISHADAGTRIHYTTSAEEALNMVSREKADIAFLLNPLGIDEIMEVAETGARLPRNSVFFQPGVPSGLVMHSLE